MDGIPDAKRRRRRRTVGLFGFSANPPTIAHAKIVRHFMTANVFDELLAIPVYRHIYAHKARQLAPFDTRMAMCRLAFAPDGAASSSSSSSSTAAVAACPVVVSDAERSLHAAAASTASTAGAGGGGAAAAVGTVDLVRHLAGTDALRGADLALVLGEDAWRDLAAGRWKDGPALLALLGGGVHVVARAADDGSGDDNDGGGSSKNDGGSSSGRGGDGHGGGVVPPGFSVARHVLPGTASVSSTAARAAAARGDAAALGRLLPAAVARYVRAQGLYGFPAGGAGAGAGATASAGGGGGGVERGAAEEGDSGRRKGSGENEAAKL